IKSLGDLAQEYPRLADRIEKLRVLVAPDFCRQQVKDAIGHRRWREHLIAAEVREAVENVRVVIMPLQHRRASSNGSADTLGSAREKTLLPPDQKTTAFPWCRRTKATHGK